MKKLVVTDTQILLMIAIPVVIGLKISKIIKNKKGE